MKVKCDLAQNPKHEAITLCLQHLPNDTEFNQLLKTNTNSHHLAWDNRSIEI